ncbi:MAG: hydroxymethylglutaryl-CoA reductase, degradative [Legionellales bacterium]|nr:hydroxymethylglutaryl-CoA reductase, degradative [Legionellales bacterium]
MNVNFFRKFKGFFKLSRSERLASLLAHGFINKSDLEVLRGSSSPRILDHADNLIENTVGCFPLPLGIATNCVIDGKPRLIPMAVEETSIIAALSSAGKWVSESNGHIKTSQNGWGVRGQLFFTSPAEIKKVTTYITSNEKELISKLNLQVVPSMVRRGGGICSITPRGFKLKGGGRALAVDIVLDACEAMGANLVCQIAEALKDCVFEDIGAAGKLAIVSNLSDCQITQATLVIPNADPSFAEDIVEAGSIAASDPYRAVTHNKGVLNGVDAVAIATGNDWRAIEASLHGYAAMSGSYRPLTSWEYVSGDLIGSFEGPIPVAFVGGATNQEVVNVCKKILGASGAKDLAAVFAAVGLLQNFAALKALVGDGIVAGHMRLHIDNLMAESRAEHCEFVPLRTMLEERLCLLGKVTMTDVVELLQHLRLSQNVVEG